MNRPLPKAISATARAGVSGLLLAVVMPAAPGGLGAAEETPSVRKRIAERLRQEISYKPVSDRPVVEVDEGDVVKMDPFVVEEDSDNTKVVARALEEKRRLEIEKKPSLEGGASIDTSRMTIGPRPRRDLFRADSRFKPDKAVTPSWTLLDMRL